MNRVPGTDQPSVQLYSVRDAFAADPDDTLRRLADIGFRQVEPYGVLENRDTLRTGLTAHGLTAPTAHARLLGLDHVAVLEAAAELGIDTVIDPYVDPERWESESDITATADGLNRIAADAAATGVTVGYHNHWWELRNRIGGRHALEVFTDKLDPAVVLEIDTYWATAGGADTPGLLTRLGERVVAIHVKDGGLDTDATGQVPAGQGRVPVAEVLAAAGDALRVVEFDAYAGDIFDGLAASHAYLTGAA